MYGVVADVERYPEFLPWCTALRVLSREKDGAREILLAEMVVGYRAIRERYTSRVVLDPEADWHLFAGDETCIPGIFGMLEALPAGARAWAFIEIPDPGEKQNVRTDAELHLEWIERRAAAGPSSLMLERLRAFALPPDTASARPNQ